jgi:hypothetical protein
MADTLAARIWDGDYAGSELEEKLSDAGVPFERLGWDSYDVSLELHGVPADYRLNADAQKLINEAGFGKVYVNHVDKWETHYNFKKDDFTEVKGWRVSYPHKRGEGEQGIWVEEQCPTWPRQWFDTGYAVVKSLISKPNS